MQPVRSIFLVERGIFKMVCAEGNGRELIVAFRGPGWLLGASGALLRGDAELTAESVSESEVRSLDAEQFRRNSSRDPVSAAWVQRKLADEVRTQDVRLGWFLRGAEARLVSTLLELALQPDGRGYGAHRLALPIRQRDLAAAIGGSRETVTRLLGRLEGKGIVNRKGGWITVSRIPANVRIPSAGVK